MLLLRLPRRGSCYGTYRFDPVPSSLEYAPGSPVQTHRSHAQSQYTPSPHIRHFPKGRPNGVLLPPVLVELGHLVGVGQCVPASLGLFILVIAANVA